LKNKQKFLIVVIVFYISLCIIACSSNKGAIIDERTATQKEYSSENKQIGIKQQMPPQSKAPFIDTTPVPIVPDNIVIIKPITVSSFTTTLLDQHKNRIDNIRLASKKINNYILTPGRTFSFNNIVGKRGTQNGYKVAKILVDGEKDEDIGGGICQISSTIYQAAKKLKLEITERHTHSGDVHYIPIGEDAAVNYKDKDLKFVNTKTYSIQFKVIIKKGKLTVTILKINKSP
jgi:vancomycin resistance protein YoaR